ncbi:PEP/pyruvate-binding domain-containing protein [Microlunatus soli]|uniref:Pyruvate, water dikinase n=1 Tax=Microlunatus soli TaxID=630515 RepID=A0A1H1VP11_9ACTN|nr:PEP/pyruvate-binding domain-containing protein [Microlunatus soli]SDS86141.1 pyruvate, water dikinase [Microlunatus soli]
MLTIPLSGITPDLSHLVGGKAAGLGRLIAAGEQVPDGFCLTTHAFRRHAIPRDEVLAAYRAMGSGPVAVRSSATVEDGADASFAGQLDTLVNVSGPDELINAIDSCWASLESGRAVAYRSAVGRAGVEDDAQMAVVVQRMIDPAAAGVTFTANPITGTRTEMVIDAVAGLGTAVVDGSTDSDHFLIKDGVPATGHGCLSTAQLALLRRSARRIEAALGGPQDLEWAFDTDGELWLLQARPITTLFPVPERAGDDLRVFLEVGHMQGMLRPVTPMGMSVLTTASDHWFTAFGLGETAGGLWRSIGGRMYIDLTGMFHHPRLRDRIPAIADTYGPGVGRALTRLLDDPRLAARPGAGPDRRVVTGIVARLARSAAAGIGALARPAAARRTAFAALQRVIDHRESDHRECGGDDHPSASDHLRAARNGQDDVLLGAMMELLPPLYAGLASSRIAAALLGPIPEPGEIDTTQRGMPYNVTSEMDLELWRIAVAARPHRDLFISTSPVELARMYGDRELPDIGLEAFLDRYGVRGAAEIDVGVPRWSEDPSPVFAALAGYLRVEDPDQAPDRRFEVAAAEAEVAIDRLIGRAVRSRPIRAAAAGFLLRRSRELAGLRELPKFLWIHPLADIRRRLLAAGAELARDGRLSTGEDIMFLTLDEADRAAAGTDQRELAAERRAVHQRELRRPRVPGLLLSDGTMPEAQPDEELVLDDSTWAGVPAAAGRVTGTVRVLHDPATARLEPGDIIVAATTDPGWTPLFLTAGGLITETGSPMAHGPTVAREYGIPAVICIPDATSRLTDGQLVTVDGNSGTVHLEAADAALSS